MHPHAWSFKKDTAASTWIIDNVPEGAHSAAITHVITDGGQILQPDQQMISPDGLELSFGVQEVKGTAYGTYFLEEEEASHTAHEPHHATAGVINVTQNNYPKG